MFSFLRRRKPVSLSLLEREPVASQIVSVESAVSEPEQVRVAAAESKPVDLPPALPEPVELTAKSMPARFVPASPTVSNLYAIPNAGVKFAVAQKLPEEPAVETGGDSESPHEEDLGEAPIAPRGDTTAEESVASEEVVSTEDTLASQTPAEQTSTEPEGDLEASALENLPKESVAGQEVGAAEESVAIEETVFGETRAPESDADISVPAEVAATELPVAEADAEIISAESVASDTTETESSDSERVAPDLAHRLAVLEDSLRQQASATTSKPKRRWWSFWRKRQPADKSVGETLALEIPAAEAGDSSATEAGAPTEQLATDQLPVAEPEVADVMSGEALVTEAPSDESPAENPAFDPEASSLTETILPSDAIVADETAEIECQPETPSAPDIPANEAKVVVSQAEDASPVVEASEVPPPENEAAEVAVVGYVPTAEEYAALEIVHLEIASNETEQIDLPVGAAPVEPTVTENVSETGTEVIAVAETGDGVSVAQDSITEPSVPDSPVTDPIVPDPAATDPTAREPEIESEVVLPEISALESDVSVSEQGAPDGESLVAPQEGVAAHVSEARDILRPSVLSGEQPNQAAGGAGLLDLPRVAEPEVMDDSEEVEAYTSATAQAWLDKIDESFVEHAARLVKGRHRGRALDIGTGPGQIALKLALHLSLWKVIGVDRSQKMIDEAIAKLVATPQATGRLEFRVADGNRLDFPNATFDLVICNSVLHHFAEPRNLLTELARVTKPRGAILLRDLRRPSRLEYPFHVRWHGRHYDGAMGRLYRDSVRAAYTAPELQRMLDASPLRGARVFRHGSTHIGLERPYNW